MAVRRGRIRLPPRGQFTSPTSRTGKAFVYGGRRVLVKGDHFQLTWLGPEVVAAIAEAVYATFVRLQAMGDQKIKSIVPVDTGYLQATTFVTISVEGDRLILRIGADTPYAIYVELGTYKMRAQPYIRPTVDYVVGQLVSALQAEASGKLAS